MAGFLVQSEQTKILAAYLNGGTFTNTATLYLGLCTGVNQTTGVVSGEPAIGTNAYARVVIAANGTTQFGAAASGAITNSGAALTFPTATPGAWTGTLTTWFLSTSATLATAIMFGALGASVTVSANQAPTFSTSQLTLTATSY
jgi:hypothetical protein